MTTALVDSAKDHVIYNFTGISRTELDNKLNLFFTSEGYRLKNNEATGVMYEKGNRTLRILFGAFVKYHKQFLAIREDAGIISVKLQRESSGMSGGLIGVNQVRKEFGRLTESFKVYFN